jgi:hypothetical protein
VCKEIENETDAECLHYAVVFAEYHDKERFETKNVERVPSLLVYEIHRLTTTFGMCHVNATTHSGLIWPLNVLEEFLYL